MTVAKIHMLGSGVLSWTRNERIGDRYGIVFLMQDGQTSETKEKNSISLNCHELEGTKGKLVARVIQPRKSTHIGDLFHGFFPVAPKVNEEIELGEGELFFELFEGKAANYDCVGLRPNDNRETFWLNPEKLYRAHEQLVELHYEPID